MSLILEALKRSEKERKQQAEAVTDTVFVQMAPRRRSLWPVVLVALLLVNIGIMLFLWWRYPAAVEPGTDTPSPQEIIAAARQAGPVASPPPTADPTPHIARRILRPLQQELGNTPIVTPQRPRAETETPSAKPETAPLAANEPPPTVGEMDEATLQQLQQYQINIIVHSDIPARRYALIDMQKLREGDRLPGSRLRIERIVQGALIIDTGHGLVRYSGTP